MVTPSFKDILNQDVNDVFMNTDEFAENRTVRYDGNTYADIPVVMDGPKESAREQSVNNHEQGLYLVTDIMHVALSDIGGIQPEKGCIIEVNTREGGLFFRRYYIALSQNTVGMIRMELEAIDE